MQPDDGAAAGAGGNVDLIHVGPHEEQPAPAALHDVFRSQRIGDGGGVEPAAFVADLHEEALVRRPVPFDHDLPFRHLAVTVADGVDDRFADGHADIVELVVGLLDHIVPDVVHVMVGGQIVKSGPKELALELEKKGYDWVEKDLVAA